MKNPLIEMLKNDGLLDEETAVSIEKTEATRPFSLHWELQTLLWLGVVLLNTGLGILIYENIDTIGHAVLIAAIGALSICCFWYVWKHRRPFELGETEPPTPFFDYILLLGCFALVIMLGYWQFQYQIFGTRYGLATLLPTLVFFAVAYRFDHRGVLSLAITGLASWVGISVTPESLLTNNDFSSENLTYTGIAFGAVVTAAAMVAAREGWKRHFTNTYLYFTVHIFCIACLFAMIQMDQTWAFLPVLLLGAAFFFWYAQLSQSFFFLTSALVYAYIGITYWFFAKLVLKSMTEWVVYLILLYFIASCTGIILFLMHHKKLLAPKTQNQPIHQNEN